MSVITFLQYDVAKKNTSTNKINIAWTSASTFYPEINELYLNSDAKPNMIHYCQSIVIILSYNIDLK